MPWAIGLSLLGAALTAAFVLRPEVGPLRITKITRLTNSGRAWIHEPLVTDGTRLFYTEMVDTETRPRQMLLDGADDAALTAVPPNALIRGFTPDRTMFAAVLRSPEPDEDSPLMWLLPVAGGPARHLGTSVSNEVAWSPDRQSVAFVTRSGVWVADADGGHERQIARLPHGAESPRWSPDGRSVRFTTFQAKDQTALWEVRTDGQDLHPVSLGWSGPPSEGFGSWTTDGQTFVFTSGRGDSSNLWALQDASDWWHRRRSKPVRTSTR